MTNPILARELRARSRRIGTTVSLTLFVLIMTGVGLIVWVTTNTASAFSGNPAAASTIGTNLFEWIVITMILVMCFIIPGFTGSSISGERDRQTLVPMQVTLLTPFQIVTGKLLASLAYTALLLSACLPLFAIAFLVGGITAPEVALACIALAILGILLGSMSILASTLVKRTGPATVLSYVFMLSLLIGTPLLAFVLSVIARGTNTRFLAALNPIVFVGSMLRLGGSYDVDSFTPLRSAGSSAVWWSSALWFAALTLVSLVIATRRVKLPMEKDR
jgi:ABC-2 type transport system permease protein